MKTMILSVLLLLLIGCASVGVKEEVKNSDGSYKLLLQGNAYTGKEIVEKFDDRSTQICGKDNYYSLDVTKKRFISGHPTLEVILYCLNTTDKLNSKYENCLKTNSAANCRLIGPKKI